MRGMGAIEKSKEECRDLRRGGPVGDFIDRVRHDVRFASRLFRRRPGPISIAIGRPGVDDRCL
jgi:hypothetical protein